MNTKKMAIKNTQIDNIHIEVNNLYYLEAPVIENQIIGSVKIKIADKAIGTLAIQNIKTVEKKNIKDYFMDFLSFLPWLFSKNLLW